MTPNTNTTQKRELRVRPIENGTVIDHIKAGQSLNVLRILGIPDSSEDVVSVVINASGEHGKKDVVKIENRELNVHEVDKITLIAPNAVINIIRNFDVFEKKHVVIPQNIEGVVRCINPNCISNSSEPVTSKFAVTSAKGKIVLRCKYCERVITENIADRLL
ncbi:MAG: aspartate carbamoyltransferase regulatory subunit [Methanosarcinaceae archaeon]|nr:aspartate carbamoyltransferase regulatory subunit [Methanosarcinaceae archaeon]